MAMCETFASSRPMIFKDSFNSSILNSVISGLGGINTEHAQLESLHIYKEDLQRPDLKDKFLRRIATRRSGFWDALISIETEDNIVLTCHQAEMLVPDLKSHLDKIIRENLNICDIPLGGFDVTLYAGINSATPVRCDSEEIAIFYFHLGPEPKTIALKETTNLCLDEHFFVEKGDVLFIPELCKHQHLFTGTSAGIAVGLRRLSGPNLGNFIFAQLFRNICNNAGDSLNIRMPWPTKPDSYVGLNTIIKDQSETDVASREHILAASSDFMFGQLSKKGWRSGLIEPNLSSVNPTHVRVNPLFKLILIADDTKMIVYAGAKKVCVPFNRDLAKLIELLERKKILTIKDAVGHLTPRWSDTSAQLFLQSLARSGSIEFCSPGGRDGNYVD